jgi:ribosomal protein S19
MKAEKKRRTEKVRRGDRNVEKRVHQGKGYAKVTVSNERGRGKKWGEFVKTRKPCTMGALRKTKGKGKGK